MPSTHIAPGDADSARPLHVRPDIRLTLFCARVYLRVAAQKPACRSFPRANLVGRVSPAGRGGIAVASIMRESNLRTNSIIGGHCRTGRSAVWSWPRLRDRTRPDTVRSRIPGFTLVEVMVVLVIVGLGFALAAPSLISPAVAPEDSLQRVVDGARRAAIRRAEVVTLSIAPDGAWIVESGSGPARRTLQFGTIEWSRSSEVRLHISSLGACMAHTSPELRPSLIIDPVNCRLVVQ